jgi:hypothetical protein
MRPRRAIIAHLEAEAERLRAANDRNEARLEGLQFACAQIQAARADGDDETLRIWLEVNDNIHAQWEDL